MSLKLPKGYLSYSQIRLWLDDKQQYRARYYLNQKGDDNQYLRLGKEVAEGLEKKTIKIDGLIQYPVQEEPIELNIDGVLFKGFLDQFHPEKRKFREIKTGIKKPNGKPRWTQKEVDEHIQLDIYSLSIQLKYGSVDDECHLDWLHTRKKKVFTEFNGIILEGEGKEMELTGEITSFTRVITQKERDRIKALIVSVGKEIATDYERWLSMNITD